jgi:hypothetical protein
MPVVDDQSSISSAIFRALSTSIPGQLSFAASSAFHKGLTLSRCFQPSDAPAGHIAGWICEDLRDRLGKRYREPVARSIGSQASTELLDCSVISNWTGRPVFFWTIVARCRTLAPEQTSSNRSLTRSQARSLLSIDRLKIARSRLDLAISRRTRMDQTCLGSRGFFWPISNPLFQGRRGRSIGRTGIGVLHHPAHRAALLRAYGLYRLSSLSSQESLRTDRNWREAAVRQKDDLRILANCK